MLKRERFRWEKLGLEIVGKGVFLQRQRGKYVVRAHVFRIGIESMWARKRAHMTIC